MKLKPGLGAFYATDQEMDQAHSTTGADRATDVSVFIRKIRDK